MNRSFAQGTIIPLAPLPEQKRIVENVDKLLTRVYAVRERLSKVQQILKRFRQSVLSSACSSHLTADWREKKSNIFSSNQILVEIKKNRLELATTSGQKKKIKEIYSYKEKENSDRLPENWEYIALDKLCNSFQYGTSKKSEASGNIPVLRMGNIKNGRVDWTDLVYTSNDTEIKKYELNSGDVLFNRTNSPELVGKTGIYMGEQPAIFAGYLIRINKIDELESKYLNYCLNSPYAKEFCLRVKTDGVSQSNINAQKLGKFEVPFCPKE
ncbi:MAG: restriction endonuclease subunit S, partial [Deltaproteobacteria bacterium]|nr:restriction endonuclease subunit S [Deltaproteobacteria bacterium]